MKWKNERQWRANYTGAREALRSVSDSNDLLSRSAPENRISFLFAWYDLWVGAFWDKSKRRLYILPVPCFGIVIQFAVRGR